MLSAGNLIGSAVNLITDDDLTDPSRNLLASDNLIGSAVNLHLPR